MLNRRPAVKNAIDTLLGRAAIEAAVAPLLEKLETRAHFSVAPVAVPGGPYSVAEGQSVTISGLASTDSDGTVVSYQWDNNYNASKGFKNRIAGGTWTFTADDSGTRTIALRVVDNTGDVSAVQTATINISDVAPTITLTAPATADEASPASVSWSYTDPGVSDAVTAWAMNWGDGTTSTFAGNVTASTHTYDENGSYTMTLTATQADGQTSVTHGITVNNVTPIVTATTPHSTIDEGENVQVDFSSPNRGGTLDGWTINWGDGITEALPATRSHAAHFYTDSGNYTATVTAQEPDGGSGSTTINYVVNNVAPTVAITGTPASEVEGHSITVGSTVSDPGQDDTETYGWTVYRNGSLFTLPGGTVTNGTGFTFMPTDNGSYVVRLSVMDDEGAVATVNSSAIAVANVNPTAIVTGTPGAAINEGATVSLTATPSDAGSEDTFTYAWSVTKNGSAFALPNGATTNAATFSFVPTDNGSYIATVVVSDDDAGTVSVSTAAITVNNVNPTASITGTPASGPEGSLITVAADPHDAGAADTFAYAWSVTKNGSAYTLPGGTVTNAATFAFTPTDNGSYVISLTVTDDDGGSVSATSSAVTVTNVAPTAVITGPATGEEGSALNFTVAASDAGTADTESYLWSVTKGGVAYTLPGGTTINAAGFGFTPIDDGAYVVSVLVTDDDGGTVTMTQAVTVANATPAAAITGAPTTGTEGASISVGSAVTDAGINDTFSYAWSVTKGGVAYDLTGVTTNSSGFAFTPDDNGSYVITMVVTDNGGATRSVSTAAITVANVNPTGSVTGEPGSSIDEGTAVNLTAAGLDDGAADTLGYAWTITKDGSAWTPPTGTVLNTAGLSFVPTDNGSYVATVAITDDDGGTVSVSSQAIVATNVAPTAAITGAPASGTEGSPLSLASTVTDPGAADTFTYAWSVTKDGTAVNLTGVTTNAATFAFTPADNGSYVFTLAVTDDDGGTVTTSSTLTVNNAPPVPVIGGNSSVNEDAAISLTVAAHDPGTLDTHTYLWSVTKGGSAYTLPGGTTTNASSFTFTPNVQGSYVVSCVVTDNDGAAATATKTITATNVAPTAAITGVPSGPRAEGSPITLHGTATDASGETGLTYAWSVTRGGVAFALPGGTVTNTTNFEFTPTDNGQYRATFAVTDSGGLTTTATTSNMVVTNALPDATMTGIPSGSVAEGTAVTLGVTAADPGAEDTLSYAWTVTKNGSAFALPSGTAATGTSFTFTPTDNGTFVATCVVTDDDGGPVSVNSGAIAVTNVNPTVAIVRTGSGPISEGQTVYYNANPTDAGTADTFTYQWTATKNGQAYALGSSATSQQLAFVPADQGTYVLSVTVSDDDGGTVSASTSSISVTNSDPIITLDTVAATGTEGVAFDLQGVATDPGTNDVLTYAWTVVKPDGTQVTVPGITGSNFNGAIAQYTPADNGTYYARLTVTDADGGTKLGSSHAVVVANANPFITSLSCPTTGTEGTAITASVTATDVAADPLSYSWSVSRAGQQFTLPNGTVTNASSFTFTPTDNGTYTIALTVADDENGFVNVTRTVTVANAAPTAFAGGDTSGFEGTAVTVGVTATDPGSEDVAAGLQYAWSVAKDGQPYQLPNGLNRTSAAFSFVPTDNGTYVATCVVSDRDSAQTTVTRTVEIANVAPTATLSGAPTVAIDEGTEVTMTAAVTDPGTMDNRTMTWSVTKDGQPFLTAAPSSNSVYRFTPTDNGSYVVTLVVNDGLATDTVSTAAIVVNNVAPAGTISGPATSNEGSAVTLTAAVTDAGSADVLSYAWTMTKDGTATALPGGIVTNAATLVYTPADQGAFVFTCVVTDDDGGTATLTHSLAVANVNPVVTQTGVPATGNEGTAITVGSTATDPGDDTLSYGWTVYRNGVNYPLPSGTNSTGTGLTFTPTDNGSYVVRLSVTDGDNGITTVNSSAIVVANVAPVVEITGTNVGIDGDEGEPLALGSDVTDAGTADTAAGFTYAWTAKQGNVTIASGDDADFSFTPPVHGSYTVALSVTDKDGATTTTSTSVYIANTAPVINGLDGDRSDVTEGDDLVYAIDASDAPGDLLSYAWQVKRGQNVFAGGTGRYVDFTAARGNYVITVTATDTNGTAASADYDLHVGNAAPTGALTGPTGTLMTGSTATFALTYGDVPANQPLAVTWDFGDGSTATGSVTGDGSAAKKHAYATHGTYTVTATIDDGVDETVVSTTITVSEAAIIDDPASAGKRALLVMGSAANDVINVTQQSNGKYGVTFNGDSLGSNFNVNGRVYVYGNGGSNTINVSGSQGATVFAGGGASSVTTGAGNDIVVGSSGADRLTGGDGRDVLIGMAGADVLRGGDGEDLLIAGGVKSTDVNSLKSIADKWANPVGDTVTRRKAITGIFSKQLVSDNGSNQLYGDAKNDWFSLNTTADKVKDLQKTDLVN